MSNFKLKQNEGEVMYWKSFTSTCEEVGNAQNFSSSNGTVFHIESLTGKSVAQFSAYPSEKEVMFTPFTYFIIDRIVKTPNKYDEVWLREMPSPITWKSNLLLWIDDLPTNNLSIIQEILKSGNV